MIPNLYGAVIARPSLLKTPAIDEAIKPLRRLEIKAKKEYEGELKEFAAAELVAKEKKKLAEGEIRRKVKDGGDAASVARELVDGDPRPPLRRRYIVNDSTVEKLGEILNENPNGVLVFRDELIGLLKSLDKEGHEGSRAFYLEAWNGTGPFVYDRIGRGTIDIEAAILSVFGGIQPGPLASYQRKAVENAGDDGLLARFQLAVWPDVPSKWTNVDREPDSAARERAFRVFEAAQALDLDALGATVSNEEGVIPFLRFSTDAQVVFDAWREELEPRLRSGDEHPAVESHLAKYRSLIPSLALLIHLVDGETGPVSGDAVRKAVRWGEYLESHARRLYAATTAFDVQSAKALATKIRRGDVVHAFTQRDVYRKGWTGLGRETVASAVELLEDLDWVRAEEVKTDGRSKTVYRINPLVLRMPGSGTDRTDRSGVSNSETHHDATDRTDGSDRASPCGSSGSAVRAESHATAVPSSEVEP